MGYPTNYTACLTTADKKDVVTMRNRRHTLLGNSWSLHVIIFLMQVLIIPHIAARRVNGNSAAYAVDPSAFEWGREHCPYIHDIMRRNLVVPAALPPDWAEQHAHEASSLAEQVQSRRHTSYHLDRAVIGGGPIAALPKGLPPDVHFHAGSEVESPLDVTAAVPDDMDFALRKVFELGAKADAWREAQLKSMVK